MRKPEHDWDHWFLLFRQIQPKTGTNLAQFCRDNGLPYQNAKKAFLARRKKAENGCFFPGASGEKSGGRHKYDWIALESEFLSGDFESLSAFARAKGLDRKSGGFQKQTKDWVKKKSEIKARSEEKILGAAENLTIAKAEAAILSQLGVVMDLLDTACAQGYAVAEKVKYPLDWKFFVSTIGDLVKVQQQFLPFLARLVGRKEAIEILEKIKAGEMSVQEGAWRFEILGLQLPKTLEIELKKSQEIEDDGENLLTDEELEAEFLASIKIVNRQKAALPERKAEIEELKKVCSNSENWTGGDHRQGETDGPE